MDTLGIEKTSLVGNSFGGAIALRIATQHPERIDKLVLMGSMTEAEARDAGHDVEVHKHSFAGNGRAMIVGDTEGLVKIVAARGGPVLGLHLVGPWASELLHEGYLAVNWDALPSDVGSLIHDVTGRRGCTGSRAPSPDAQGQDVVGAEW